MDDALRVRLAAYEQTLRSTIALAEGFADADWARATDCPGWTVKDQLSHIVSVERSLLGDPAPKAEPVEWPHVRNDFGRMLEAGIEARRPVPGPEIVAELAELLPRRLAQVAATDPATQMLCPDGRMGDYARFLLFRSFDCWIHEQDIRRAVARPGNLAAPAAASAWEVLSSGLPFVVVKRAQATPGQSVTFKISGPPDHRSTVLVGDDGRGRPTDDVAEPTVTLAMQWETYVCLAAGRRGPDTAAVQISGDKDLADRVLANLAMTP